MDFDVSKAIARAQEARPEKDDIAVLGAELLAELSGPVEVSLEKFLPYVNLFKTDKERLNKKSLRYDVEYAREISQLYHSARIHIGLDPRRRMIVRDHTGEIVAMFDKALINIHSDSVKGESSRDKAAEARLPQNMNREDLIADASYSDVVAANRTDEMIQYFRDEKLLSEMTAAVFYLKNASPEAKKAMESLMGNPTEAEGGSGATEVPVTNPLDSAGIDDDED